MKCEKCELELIGEAVICGHCGHNNAHQKPAGVRLTRSLSGNLATKPEATLIPFPQSPAALAAKVQADEEPPRWRNQVRESVRLFREQRNVADLLPTDPPEPEPPSDAPHPIVEAALKRLSRPIKTGVTRTRDNEETVVDSSRPQVEKSSDSIPARIVVPEKPRRESNGVATPPPASAVKSDQQHLPATMPGSILPQPASLTDRSLALLFDLALILVASVPLYAIHSITGTKFDNGMAYSAIAIVVWVTFVYQVWTLLVARRTCGMAWRNLRVVDSETRELTFPEWRLFLRAILSTVGLVLTPLNVLIIWSSGSQAGLADVLSQTMVCHFQRPSQSAKVS